jgi:uncharacterized cupredoxin-like copper-binding protein
MEKFPHPTAAALAVFPASASCMLNPTTAAMPGTKRFPQANQATQRNPRGSSRSNGRMLFAPSRIEIKDEQVKFMLRNNEQLDHEFILATTAENLKHAESMKKNPDMEHDDPNGKRLAPKKTDQIIWRFTEAGAFEYSCPIPGHRNDRCQVARTNSTSTEKERT